MEPSQKKYLSLAIPNILSNLTVPLAGLFDMAFLGHLDSITPLAGVALATVIFDYLYWGLGFLRMGTTGLTAQAYGRGDEREQGELFWRSFLFALLLGAGILAFRGSIRWFSFWIFQGDPEVELAGMSYFDARIPGVFPALGIYVVNGWLLGCQKPRAVLAVTICLNGLNIVLDYLFICIMGWGAAGAGIATMSAEWVALILGGYLVARAWPQKAVSLWKTRWTFEAIQRLMTLSGHLFLRTFLLLTTFALFLNLSALQGAIVLAMNAILLRFLSTAAYFIDGWAFALESLAGEYAEKEKRESLRRSLYLGGIWTGITVLLFMFTYQSLGTWFISFLTSHEGVVEQAGVYLPLLLLLLPFAGAAYLLDGYFIGLTKGGVLSRSMVLAILSFLPWALAGYWQDSVALLWIGLTAFLGMRALSLTLSLQKHGGLGLK